MFGRFASWNGPPLLSVRHSTFRANGHSAQVLSIRGPQSSLSAILYVWEGSGRMVISHASRVHVRNSQRLATVRRSYFEGSASKPDYPCGVSAFKPILGPNRISNGWEAAKHSFPWHVLLIIFDDHSETRGSQCGGSLIRLHQGNATDLVLTAAHCIYDHTRRRKVPKERIVVTVGIHRKSDPERTRVRVKDFEMAHYTGEFDSGDIALLRLNKQIPYTRFTRPVCLPARNAALPAGKECYVSGHGNMYLEGVTTPDELRMVDVDVLSSEDCAKSRSDPSKLNLTIQFCAGTNGRTTRKGDSGGPLVCKEKDVYTQFGVVSFGSADYLHLNAPGIFTFVPKYIDWIESSDKTLPRTTEILPEDEIHEYLTNLEKLQAKRNRSQSTGSLDTGRRKAPRPAQLALDDYKCGIPSPMFPVKMSAKGFNRIVAGWEANKHSLPWMVIVTFADPSNPARGNTCGGTLIQLNKANRTDLVLTAAHCLYNEDMRKEHEPKNGKVLVGAHNQYSVDTDTKQVNVKQLALHPQYNSDGSHNDIGLVKLTQSIPYTDFTRPVCLPSQGEKIPVGTDCIVAGWGRTSHYSTMHESDLQMTIVQVADINECKKETSYVQDTEVICTKGKTRAGFCNGDSGGPLICKKGEAWVQYGIVSFSGVRCAFDFDKYTNVSSYLQWIKQQDQKLPAATSEFPYEGIIEYLSPMELINGPKRHTLGAIEVSGTPSSGLPSKPSAVSQGTITTSGTSSSRLPSRPAAANSPSSVTRLPSRGISPITVTRPKVFSRFL